MSRLIRLGSYLGFLHWRVTVDDEFYQLAFVEQEVLPDPEKVFFFLVLERDAGPHAGVDK